MTIPSGWAYDKRKKSIHRTIICKDFMAAVRLINRIARLAEKMDHHPDLHLTHYKRLKIVLTTHEKGGVIEKDVELAQKISNPKNGRMQ